jgi:D-alanyl-D-alanine carboxypeptidase (penicillin-binding protein 5/6)
LLFRLTNKGHSRAKRRTVPLLVCGFAFGILSFSAWAGQPPVAQDSTPAAHEAAPEKPLPPLKPPQLQCASAILMDAASGQVLYQLNADVQRPMASTTKIMTALLFCESVPEDSVVTASEKACSVAESSLHLKKGEQLKARDLLRAILMRSANDGCVAAAERAAGSVSAFVDRMNAKAAELGATRTHFMNPHGLHDPKHYTTARDLATIARAAMQVPRIEEVVKCEKCRITRSIDKKDLTMRNHSHFLGHYPGADGVKTGWTIPAGHCYVGSATIGGWRLIAVVLKSKSYVKDTAALMSYGFRQFAPQTIARTGDAVGSCPVTGGDAPTVAATVDRTVQFITRKTETPQIEKVVHYDPVHAPVSAGAKVGSIEVIADGKHITTAPLVAAATVSAPSTVKAIQKSAPWKGLAMTTTIFAVGLVSLRYGTRYGSRIAAIAKSARRRRRRLAQKLRSDDHRG